MYPNYSSNIIFPKNCLKMREIGPRGASLAPHLDPPMKLNWGCALGREHVLWEVVCAPSRQGKDCRKAKIAETP